MGWCAYCYYMGFGCMAPTSKGCCLSIGELCCCAGTCKSATCCDDDGCVASTTKCCCCLVHGEVPPSNTPGVGCGPAMWCSKWNEDSTNPYEQEEMSLLKSTFWCLSAYCCGIGCNSPGGSDPCCKQEGKLCCLWMNLETDSVAIIRCAAGTCQRRRRA